MSSLWNPKTLVTRFVALLDDAGSQVAESRAVPAPGPPAEARILGAGSERAALENKLREILVENAQTSGGRVQILNLSSLRERYASRWPLLSEKINQLVGMTLARRLAARDVFTRCGEGVYVIIFDSLPEAEAKLKCSLIAEEILGKLLGQGSATSMIGVASATTRIDHSLEVTGYTRLEALEELLQSAPPFRAGDAAAAPSMGAVRDVLELASHEIATWIDLPGTGGSLRVQADYMTDLLQQADAVLKDRVAAQTLSSLNPGAQDTPADAAELRALTGQLAEMQQAVAKIIEQAAAELGSRKQPGVLDAAALESAELIFRYQPGWYVPSKVIANYRCLTGLKVEGQEIYGAQILSPDAEPRVLATIDRLVLRQAIDAIQLLKLRQEQTTIAVPVHHGALTRVASRQSFLSICKAIDAQTRRYVVWEIVDPVIGFANSYLPATVSLLQQHGRAVTVRVDLDHARFDEFAGIGVHAVGIDLSERSVGEAELITKLNLFRSRSERHNLKGFVHGLQSPSALLAAIYAGFEYVAGPAVAALVPAPEPVLAFGIADLYGRAYTDS